MFHLPYAPIMAGHICFIIGAVTPLEVAVLLSREDNILFPLFFASINVLAAMYTHWCRDPKVSP